MNRFINSFLTLAFLFISSCATLPEEFEQPELYAYTDTDDTLLGRDRHEEKLVHFGKSGFQLLGFDASERLYEIGYEYTRKQLAEWDYLQQVKAGSRCKG